MAQRFAEDLRKEGFEAASNTGSVGIEVQARGMVAQTIEQLGKIDILINNAGYAKAGAIKDTSTADLTATPSKGIYQHLLDDERATCSHAGT